MIFILIYLQEKCTDYLPPSEITDCHRLFGDFQVTLKKREVKDKYIISSLQLKVCTVIVHIKSIKCFMCLNFFYKQ